MLAVELLIVDFGCASFGYPGVIVACSIMQLPGELCCSVGGAPFVIDIFWGPIPACTGNMIFAYADEGDETRYFVDDDDGVLVVV